MVAAVSKGARDNCRPPSLLDRAELVCCVAKEEGEEVEEVEEQ
jgi:hypothetical protein